MNKLCPLCKKKVTKNQPHVFQDGKITHKSCYDQLESYEKDYQTKGIKIPRFPFYTVKEIEDKRKKANKMKLP